MKCVYVYIWLLIKIPLSRNGHSSRIKILLSRNFRELHVYLSRGPCWPTTPLMKIRSPPAKLRQRIMEKRRPGALVFGSRKASLLETWLLLLAFSGALLLPDPGRQWVATFTYNDYNTQLSRNFRKIKLYFRELEKNFREGFQHNMHGFRN